MTTETMESALDRAAEGAAYLAATTQGREELMEIMLYEAGLSNTVDALAEAVRKRARAASLAAMRVGDYTVKGTELRRRRASLGSLAMTLDRVACDAMNVGS